MALTLGMVALAAGVGAALGGGSFLSGVGSQNKEIDRQRRALREKGQRQLELMDAQWEYSVKQANKTAMRADAETTLNEGVLGTNANGALRGLSLEEEMNAFLYNEGAIQAGSSEGNALHLIASNGTRGSSALQGTQMSRDMSDEALQMREDYDRANEKLSLENAINNLVLGAQNLQERRTDAEEMRESYSEGGDQWNLYQKTRANYQADIDSALKTLKESKTTPSDWQFWTGILTAGLGGAKTGVQTAATIDNYNKLWSEASLNDIGAFDTNNLVFSQSGTSKLFDVNSINFGNLAPMGKLF